MRAVQLCQQDTWIFEVTHSFFFARSQVFSFFLFFFFFYCALRNLFGKCVSILVSAHFLLSDKEKIYISTTTEHISQNLHINRLYLDVCKNKIIITFIFFLFCNEENYSSDFYHSSKLCHSLNKDPAIMTIQYSVAMFPLRGTL